jgi:hypothetical protein
MSATNPIFDQFLSGISGSKYPGGNLPLLADAQTGEIIKSMETIRAEWLKSRWGRFTASNAHKLMTNGKTAGSLSVGAQTYIKEVAMERLTFPQTDGGYISPSMLRGLEQEIPALNAFMENTGLVCTAYGDKQKFLELGPDFGGTPDCLIPSENSGVEVKAPNSVQHWAYMGIFDADSLKEIEPQYYWQVISLCLITGSSHWYFVSWDDRFKDEELRLHIALIESCQQDMDLLIARLSQAIEFRDGILGRFQS